MVGGAGYIGSHICKLFRHSGIEHIVFDNFEEGHRAAISGSPYIEGDLRRPADLKAVFEGADIDVVMHFAAYISVGESVSQPAKYFANNTAGVLNLLDAMSTAGVSKFVFSSTAAVYGEPQYVPIDEDHPKAPTSPYGESKLSVERMLPSFEVAHGIRSVCLRYFNAAGSDPEGQIGEEHRKEEHLIPLAILAAMGRRSSLKVFGTDYPTPDGTCVRDYIHVNDLADAHRLAVDYLMAGGVSNAFNLGNGQGFSVREVLDTVTKVGGTPVPAENAPRRAGDPATLIASSSKIREQLGWEPQYPDLETIVKHAWDWRRDHPNGFE